MSAICILLLIILAQSTADRQDYGPYNLSITGITHCHGPKSKTIVVFDIKRKDNNSLIVMSNLTFLEQTRIDQVKLTVSSFKDNRKTNLWTHRVDKPCERITTAAAIEKALHTKNCVVKKGNYYFVLNYLDYINAFFGTSFFYGSYAVKAVMLSFKGNILCMDVSVVFTKK